MSPNFRERANILAERVLRRAIESLEKLPPFISILKETHKIRWAAFAIAGLLAGDVSMQAVSNYALKVPPTRAPAPRVEFEPPYVKSRSVFEQIVQRNAFCPGCPVPDIKMLAITRPKDCNKAKPLSGALKVVGTIVLSDPNYSVVTVTDGGTESTALKKGDRFKEYGKVFEIKRQRICFERDDGILNFIEMPEEAIKFGQPLAAALPTSSMEGITRVNDNDVEIKRTFLTEKINDPNILFDAHAVAFKDASGAIKGFKVLSIKPGSVYESLGIMPEDTIVGVNGEPMNSIAKAQELYAAAGTADEISIDIQRGGQTIKKTFRVK